MFLVFENGGGSCSCLETQAIKIGSKKIRFT